MGSALFTECEQPTIAGGDGEMRVKKSGSVARRDTSATASHTVMVAVKALQKEYPYLAQPTHNLHQWVVQCQEAVRDGEDELAKDHLARIEQEVEREETTLNTAFKLFCPPGKSDLQAKEVKVMLEYLGFPSSDNDVKELLKVSDTDGNKGSMNLKEFQNYVARMGGSYQLFELRRKRMADKHGAGSGSSVDPAEVREQLKEAGVMEQEQAYWGLVLPRANEEFQEVRDLTKKQKSAIRSIRMLAKSNHDRVLPELQRKIQGMKFTDMDLWMTLAYIRELAPIIVHVNLTKLMPFMEKDTHYRNQFETATSGGLLKPTTREKWERGLFGDAYENAKGKDRPKYGVLNAMNDYRGVVKCAQYGDSYLVLRDIRLRCTLSPEDSANLKSDRLAVLDYYAHVLNEYSEQELRETMQVAKSSEAAVLGDSTKVGNMKYKETQLHGEICFSKHVERLVAHTKHRGPDTARLNAICKKHGWKMSWMDEEQARMKKEDQTKLGEDAWKEKLKAIMEKGTPDVKGVPEGFCRKGCGREVAPGQTKGGNTFTTCCRGCALGFGHDLTCGNIDPEMVKPGLCLNGCGRPVAKGAASGRTWTTCCRGCAKGRHDPNCGKDILPGMCKFDCGRKVAPASGGRTFDSCCRSCAVSKGTKHDDQCQGES